MKISPCLPMLIASAAPLCSCVHEEGGECPPLVFEVWVKDKNYVNAIAVDPEAMVDEGLPFSAYVQSYCYTLRRVADGMLYDSRELAPPAGGSARKETIAAPYGLPFGRYVVTVWANVGDRSALSSDALSLRLHPEPVGGSDPYLANDTICYGPGSSVFRLGLERVKGMVSVTAENLPIDAGVMECSISGISSEVSHGLDYGGSVAISAKRDFVNGGFISLSACAAPSPHGAATIVSASFASQAGPSRDATGCFIDGGKVEVAPVRVVVERNRITLLRYIWNPADRGFDVQTMVNDSWQDVSCLEIE